MAINSDISWVLILGQVYVCISVYLPLIFTLSLWEASGVSSYGQRKRCLEKSRNLPKVHIPVSAEPEIELTFNFKGYAILTSMRFLLQSYCTKGVR